MSEMKIFLSGLHKVAYTLLEKVIIKAVYFLMLFVIRSALSNDADIHIVGASGISGSLAGFFG